MAEFIGLTASVITVATSTCKAVVRLYNTVESYQSHQQRVRDFLDELEALRAVLEALLQFLTSGPQGSDHRTEAGYDGDENASIDAQCGSEMQDHDFSALKLPITRCGDLCTAFEEELLKCTPKSSTGRHSLREWARFRFMGEDVDGFRRGLAGYKLTISIALTDATLRTTRANGESIARFNGMLEAARADLEDRLCSIDDKLECMLSKDTPISEVDTRNLQIIQKERVSTEKCLEICAGLSRHIDEIHTGTSEDRQEGVEASTSNRITKRGLEGCKESLARTVQELISLERQLLDEMVARSANGPLTSIDFMRLREEREATRQAMDICTSAQEHLKESVNNVENFATGNALQFMASTDGRTIRGKNKGFGAVTGQVGGTYDPASFAELCKIMNAVNLDLTHQTPGAAASSSRQSKETGDTSLEHGQHHTSKFDNQYGKGVRLFGEDEVKGGGFQSRAAKRS
ncbi:hypothetical protein KVT40_003573 [Elsinoe batatas]|uniref:Azaphilone pigments biosynthesis cluster protein L N-terminal domain-containing protein n=1 Tax=Elsinoe batatas TaxID=2601811 RepID=A0A8K0L592_9PEZI|nr:hypothetical protein KVT40_003573 [Elsinoe batatas]